MTVTLLESSDESDAGVIQQQRAGDVQYEGTRSLRTVPVSIHAVVLLHRWPEWHDLARAVDIRS